METTSRTPRNMESYFVLGTTVLFTASVSLAPQIRTNRGKAEAGDNGA